MSVYKKNNKFVSYLIILVALFILVLVTKNQYDILQWKLDSKETNNNILIEKETKLQWLKSLEQKLAKTSENIDKYIVEIKEDELIDYLFSNIERINKEEWVAAEIKSISISEPIDTEIWFKESNITLNISVPNEEISKKILDFLTWKESKYNFFVSSFSFPYGEKKEWGYNMSIPLKVLHTYKQK